MIIPRQTIYRRQAAATPITEDEKGTTTTPAAGNAADTAPTTRTTTLSKSTSPSPSSTSDSILAQASATTNLSWWQLLCIGLGGAVLLAVIVWAWWRARRNSANTKKKAEAIAEEEAKKVKEMIEKQLKEQEEESSGSDESYDSVSDGGTIVPRRRKKRRRGAYRHERGNGRSHRRRRSDESDWDSQSSYDSESSYMSAETYYPRRRGRRSRRRRSDDYRDRDRGRDRDRRQRERDRERDRRRRHDTPSPSPSPVPPVPNRMEGKKENFRDSVFSSYTSMKKAAVRLKQVEAKAKLKKQLDEEERIERIRQAKIKEANLEFERAKRESEMAKRAKSADSQQPLIPSVHRHTQSSSGSSSRTPHLPTPPPRSAIKAHSAESVYSARRPNRFPPRQASEGTIQGRLPIRQGSGLTSEIGALLGNKPKPPPQAVIRDQTRPSVEPTKNTFQSSWLSQPRPAASVPQTPRSGSVYLAVTPPKDRPMIAPGGLAPAPPGKARKGTSSGIAGGVDGMEDVANVAGVGAGDGRKWADRLRSRK